MGFSSGYRYARVDRRRDSFFFYKGFRESTLVIRNLQDDSRSLGVAEILRVNGTVCVMGLKRRLTKRIGRSNKEKYRRYPVIIERGFLRVHFYSLNSRGTILRKWSLVIERFPRWFGEDDRYRAYGVVLIQNVYYGGR